MTSPSSPLPAHPLLRRVAVIVGWLALFATLALLGPGVLVDARAEAPLAQLATGPESR